MSTPGAMEFRQNGVSLIKEDLYAGTLLLETLRLLVCRTATYDSESLTEGWNKLLGASIELSSTYPSEGRCSLSCCPSSSAPNISPKEHTWMANSLDQCAACRNLLFGDLSCNCTESRWHSSGCASRPFFLVPTKCTVP